MTRLHTHLFVRNLARDPSSRVARRLRPGNKLGFMLDDGRRIRRAGLRPAQLDMQDAIRHVRELVEGVTYKYIEVTDPTGKVLSAQELEELLSMRPELAKKEPEKEMTRVKTEPEPPPPPLPPPEPKPEPVVITPPEPVNIMSPPLPPEPEPVLTDLEALDPLPGSEPAPEGSDMPRKKKRR